MPAITPVSGVPSVGTTIAPFLIDGASAVGSTVTVTQATSVVATPAGSAAPTTSYYKVTNLAPAAFYAVSFNNAQSDINIKVGGSIGLFGGSATPICSSSYVEPITEGCVAQAVASSADAAIGELYIAIENKAATDSSFNLNIRNTIQVVINEGMFDKPMPLDTSAPVQVMAKGGGFSYYLIGADALLDPFDQGCHHVS